MKESWCDPIGYVKTYPRKGTNLQGHDGVVAWKLLFTNLLIALKEHASTSTTVKANIPTYYGVIMNGLV